MVQVFEGWIKGRDVSAEDAQTMREAYGLALRELDLTESPVESRRMLADIILQLSKVQMFRKADPMAALAVDWYRSLRQG
jgi:hypothetical protein